MCRQGGRWGSRNMYGGGNWGGRHQILIFYGGDNSDNGQHWKSKEEYFKHVNLESWWWTSLVAQWLRIRLPMQGTQVWALVQEDPTCHGATKPVRHNCWACALEPASHSYWTREPQLLKPMRLEPVLCNKRSPNYLQLEKAHTQPNK